MNKEQSEKLMKLFDDGYTIFINNHYVDGPVTGIYELDQEQKDNDSLNIFGGCEVGEIGYSSDTYPFCSLLSIDICEVKIYKEVTEEFLNIY